MKSNKKQKMQKDILVIDDDIDTINFLRKILGGAGHNVIHALSVEEGIVSIQNYAPHLILLDYKVQEDVGFKIIHFLKSKKSYSMIPVIMMSATVNKKLVMKAILAGASEFIGKPIKSAPLLQRAKKLLKLNEFPVLNFDEPPTVHLNSIGEIIKINEMGVIIQSSIKLESTTSVEIKSDFLKKLGADRCKTHAHGEAKVAKPGVYRNEIRFRGMDEITAKKIRNIKIISGESH